ncbi:LPS translocon maturation chaperone LptM [Thalassolituus marinus]|uniref:Lipoprotein n=1 Tax=Thalassolituus marinus TaxID=671053 RepID=A0ABS7ZL19_9GAMM|nr:lipoprotein [Thalassolituus marinus]MCA6062412.1 lipoprotein [Thalassolituus marinus]
MIQLRTAFVILAALAALTACGQKGPLYLPADAPATSFTESNT